ncbi:MAG: AbrB/MazE/SpoVT family DNA-binding domain-containing protein [Methanobacterium sp.]
MVNVTKKYQVTIPREVREDLNIHQGDKVLFVKSRAGNWIIMTVEDLNSKMIESSADIEEAIKKPQKDFKKESGRISE